MAMNLAPFLRQRYFDSNGDPLAGGKLYSYAAGTSTPQSTYTNSGGGTANANPVVLDADGEAAVWLDPALSYKFVLKNSSDVEQWTEDNVVGQLSADAVATSSIQDSAVTTAKLADDSVTAAKLKDSASVDADRAVTTDHIRDAAVTRAKLVGNGAIGVTSKTTTYTALTTDDYISVDGSGGAFTITLPTASGCSGKQLYIKRTDNTPANAVTIGTLDGTARALYTQNEAVLIMSDGTNWKVLQHLTDVQTSNSLTWTFDNCGSTTNHSFRWSRRNDKMVVQGSATMGTPATAVMAINMPTGHTIDSAKLTSSANVHPVGKIWRVNTSSAFAGASYGPFPIFYDGSTTGKIYPTNSGTATHTFQKRNADNMYSASGEQVSFEFEIPITGWW